MPTLSVIFLAIRRPPFVRGSDAAVAELNAARDPDWSFRATAGDCGRRGARYRWDIYFGEGGPGRRPKSVVCVIPSVCAEVGWLVLGLTVPTGPVPTDNVFVKLSAACGYERAVLRTDSLQ